MMQIADIRLDGGTQSRAVIDQHVITEYSAAMSGGASFPPVVVFYDGADYWLADGYHRIHAAGMLGLDTIDVDIRQGGRRDAVLFSVGANAAHGLRRTNADKRRAVEVLLRDEEWAGWSDREIARRCGVSHTFVAETRSLATVASDAPRAFTTKHGTTATMNTAAIGRAPAVRAKIADELPAPAPDPEAEAVRALFASTFRKPIEPAPALERPPARDGDEWYTPARFIDAAREVMGGIDLDPASCVAANQTVRAANYYTQDEDGLALPWFGRVWLNPPYSETGEWIAKLAKDYTSGQVDEAIVLVNAKTEAGWFDLLWNVSPEVCLVRGRISFIPGDGGKSQTGYMGQAIGYLGPNAEKFREVFGTFGRLVTPVE
jgi:phage N-6-adenine-methyltransferase